MYGNGKLEYATLGMLTKYAANCLVVRDEKLNEISNRTIIIQLSKNTTVILFHIIQGILQERFHFYADIRTQRHLCVGALTRSKVECLLFYFTNVRYLSS